MHAEALGRGRALFPRGPPMSLRLPLVALLIVLQLSDLVAGARLRSFSLKIKSTNPAAPKHPQIQIISNNNELVTGGDDSRKDGSSRRGHDDDHDADRKLDEYKHKSSQEQSLKAEYTNRVHQEELQKVRRGDSLINDVISDVEDAWHGDEHHKPRKHHPSPISPTSFPSVSPSSSFSPSFPTASAARHEGIETQLEDLAKKEAEKVGEKVLHGAENLGEKVVHGIEHLPGELKHLAKGAIHDVKELPGEIKHLAGAAVHGAEHLAAKAAHGVEHLAADAAHGVKRLAHGVEHLAEKAAHKIEKHIPAPVKHAAERIAHGVEKVAHGAEHLAHRAAEGIQHGAQKVAHGVEKLAHKADQDLHKVGGAVKNFFKKLW
jgi:hypothetical protein